MNKRIFTVTLLSVLYLSIKCIAGDTMYVNSDNGLYVRTKPDINSCELSKLSFSDEVYVIKLQDDWSMVKVDEGYGFVKSEYIQECNPKDELIYMGNWRITAYASTGNPCANGNYPSEGVTVACNSLDFGTTIYIEGIGFRTVEDRGPTYLCSEWCDLYLGDVESCISWGDQYRDVYVLEE